jgi:catechol 2,3-dioxygenase
MATQREDGSQAPERAQPPVGVNHVVLTVRDLEKSHTFWTEIMGFRQVAELRPESGLPLKMRFYSGLHNGEVTHHDLALLELPGGGPPGTAPEPWTLVPQKLGLHHVAITWPDRESWLKQIAFLQSKGVEFHLRINHGMSHSAYVPDPNGYLIEVLYELPREIWRGDIDAAQNYAQLLPTEGEEALVDRTDNPTFGSPRPAS